MNAASPMQRYKSDSDVFETCLPLAVKLMLCDISFSETADCSMSALAWEFWWHKYVCTDIWDKIPNLMFASRCDFEQNFPVLVQDVSHPRSSHAIVFSELRIKIGNESILSWLLLKSIWRIDQISLCFCCFVLSWMLMIFYLKYNSKSRTQELTSLYLRYCECSSGI